MTESDRGREIERRAEEIETILTICGMAHFDDRAAEFIERGLTLDEVCTTLMELQAQRSDEFDIRTKRYGP